MDYEDEEERLRIRRGVERIQLGDSGEELGRIVAPPVQVSDAEELQDHESEPT